MKAEIKLKPCHICTTLHDEKYTSCYNCLIKHGHYMSLPVADHYSLAQAERAFDRNPERCLHCRELWGWAPCPGCQRVKQEEAKRSAGWIELANYNAKLNGMV